MMKIMSSYSVKIKHYNRIFENTASIYRKAVDFFIHVTLQEWDTVNSLQGALVRQRFVETLCTATKNEPTPRYDFGMEFYKFPCYLRRAAISKAIGMVSSYKSNLANFEIEPHGKPPVIPCAGHSFPAMYRENSFVRAGTYTARIKVWIRNTWDWLDVELKKGDVDYIIRRCANRKECAPILRKRGKEWFLDFSFEEKVCLNNTPVNERIVVAVDLGINNACTCSVMRSDGTILDRKFFTSPREQDSLNHAINRVKKAQQHGNLKTPRLWASVKGINKSISVQTAAFIIDTAILWNASIIVFEHLDMSGKKKGSKSSKFISGRSSMCNLL